MKPAELFEQWLEYKSAFCCDRTIDWYRPTSDTLRQVFGDRSADTINKLDTSQLVLKLKSQNNSPETIRRKVESLSACWDWAIDSDLIQQPRNPWRGVRKLIKVPQQDAPRPFTAKEISTIINGFEHSQRYSQLTPFVKFLFGTGLRTGEAIGLRWDDISEDCQYVIVRSQLTRGGVRKVPKNGKSREFKLSVEMTSLLLTLNPAVPSANLRFTGNVTSTLQTSPFLAEKGLKAENLVFLWNNKPICDSNFLRRPWKKILEQSGISYRKPYNTRHSFISHCLEQGINPTTVGTICGNSSRVIFTHYAGSLHSPELPSFTFSNPG